MIIIIAFTIFCVGFLLCYLRIHTFSNLKSRFVIKILGFFSEKEYNTYLVNIIVAILGVTVSIFLVNYNTEKQEEKQTIEFLNEVVLTELDTKAALVVNALFVMDIDNHLKVEIEVNGENSQVEIEQPCSPEEMFDTMKDFPLSPVLSLDLLLNDSPYKYTISRYTYSALLDCRMSFILQESRIDSSTNIEEMIKYLSNMSDTFNRACKIIEIELEYQKNKISEDDVYNEIDKLYDELKEKGNSIVIG